VVNGPPAHGHDNDLIADKTDPRLDCLGRACRKSMRSPDQRMHFAHSVCTPHAILSPQNAQNTLMCRQKPNPGRIIIRLSQGGGGEHQVFTAAAGASRGATTRNAAHQPVSSQSGSLWKA
jgi:hypothetical protein